MTDVVALGAMLAAAWFAYGSPAGVLAALGADEAGAWAAVRSVALYVAAPWAIGWLVVGRTDGAEA